MQKFAAGKFHFEPPSCFTSLDHLVGAGGQRGRHDEVKHPRGLGVDYQLELACLHDRQLRRLRPLEDAANINADLTICILNVASVAHQPADLTKVAVRKYRGERVA